MLIVRLSRLDLTSKRSNDYDLFTVKKLASIGIYASGIPVLFAFATPAFATGTDLCQAAGTNFSALCKLRLDNNAGGIVGAVVQVILILAIIITLFFLVLGGIRWMTSGGDQAKIAGARGQIIAALVGLVIALLSFAAVSFVVYFVTGQSTLNFTIPRLID